MSTILDNIIADKIVEVNERKALRSIKQLEQTPGFERTCISLRNNLLQSPTGIIAEFKRKSPSLGWIHEHADVCNITSGYSHAGASGISILTDLPYFGGTPVDLTSARQGISCAVLRKDFMIDEYQVFEAKAMGADVILLIAAALTVEQTRNLAQLAHSLGLETLLEIHNADELVNINEHIDMVGVNNRNLKTFAQSIQTSFDLVDAIPNDFVKVSESGLSQVETVAQLRKVGYKGFLMGENFMNKQQPDVALSAFIADLKALS